MNHSTLIENALSEKKLPLRPFAYALTALLLIGISFLSLRRPRDIAYYTQAQELYQIWHRDANMHTWTPLQNALDLDPSWGKRHAASIAQSLFLQNRPQEAQPFAERALKPLESQAPDHAAYAATTLCIEQEKFQEALERSVRLHEKIQADPSLQLLHAYNLLRIACLQKALTNVPGELSAWKELEELLATATPCVEEFLTHFQRDQLSLQDYLTHRKEMLLHCS